MRIARLVVVSLAVVTVATAPTLLSASEKASPAGAVAAAPEKAERAAPPSRFATLKGIDAVPMSSSELKAVKGQHVHFLDPKNGFDKVHLAGDVKTENNWSNEWGGTDGAPVAPSYNGLCVSHSVGGIFIPTMGPITTQCP
jgi:hypothetical protein